MEKNKQIHEGIEYLNNLFKEADNIELKYNPNILLKYSAIQESLPFQIYFQNEFARLIKKDSIKKDLFFKETKENIDIFGHIIKKIQKDYEEKNKKEEEKNKISEEKNKKEEEKRQNENNKKNKINDNNNQMLNNNNNISKNKDLSKRNDKSISGENISNSNISTKTQNNQNSINDSNISFIMDIVKEKLDNNMKEIDEILFQKEKLFNQIINEKNESKDNQLSYFDDTNNLSGSQFENAGTKYIFELIKCLSPTQEFSFYHNIKIKPEQLNNIFKNNSLDTIKGIIQLDFVISDLRLIDLINLLIYLYPNIIYFSNFKKKPNKRRMNLNFDKLIKLRNKYKNNLSKIDIFGEIGANIFTEDEKIAQLKKYTTINNNLEKLMEIDENESNKVI